MENIVIDSNIKSTESVEPSYCIFFNCTLRLIDLIWINYESKPIFYRTIPPQTGVSLNTYKTHPWIFKDTITGERMNVKNCNIFWPQSSIIDPTNVQVKRYKVIIHFPMRSLQENAAWKVLQLCTSESILDSLEIPIKLINELKLKFRLKKNC